MTACASVSISIFLDFGSKSCSLLFSSYLCSTLESQPQQVIPITNQNNRACSGGLGMLAVASNSYNNLRERVDRPPPFLYSQPDFRDSCLERNHMKVSSFSTHQRLLQGIIRPAGEEEEEEALQRGPPSGLCLQGAICGLGELQTASYLVMTQFTIVFLQLIYN